MIHTLLKVKFNFESSLPYFRYGQVCFLVRACWSFGHLNFYFAGVFSYQEVFFGSSNDCHRLTLGFDFFFLVVDSYFSLKFVVVGEGLDLMVLRFDLLNGYCPAF